MTKKNQKKITEAIKEMYIGAGNLTQVKMETLFHTDEFFVDAEPGFFTPAAISG